MAENEIKGLTGDLLVETGSTVMSTNVHFVDFDLLESFPWPAKIFVALKKALFHKKSQKFQNEGWKAAGPTNMGSF